jgi:hypothetical protein
MDTPPTKRALATSRRRRRQWFVGVGVVAGLSAGGGLAAALLNKGHVPRPEGGVACRATSDPRSSAIVIALGDDPVADCAALWSARRLPDGDDPTNNSGEVPSLVACVGPGGGIDVLPVGPGETCDALGLDAADVAAAVADPATILIERLVDESPACTPPAEAGEHAREVLDDLGMTDWAVVVRPTQQPDQVCSFPAVDSTLRTVFIVPIAPQLAPQPEGTS